jgi:Ca2+-binding RTX toxin-like protein
MFAGDGNDRLIVTFDSSDVHVDGGDNTDTLQMGFDDAAVADLISAFPEPLSTNPDNFTARIDLAAGTGSYRFNGTIIALDLEIENIENVDGSAFSETISGDAGVNVINGEAGNDTLQGRGGADTLNGGSGSDRAIYDNSLAIDIDLTRATQLGGEAQGDRLISIEDIDGSCGSDRIRGNAASNELFGNLGNDMLEGRGGADILDGGLGTDTATYESSFAAVFVGLDDRVGSGGDAQGDTLISIENLTGSNFDDILIGSNGDNVLIGGTGNDTLDGGVGSDTAVFASAFASVQVTLGQNGASGRAAHGTFVEDDTLISIEDVIGSNFDDAIFGNEQANDFDGGKGNDYFTDSRGDDRYLGGAGLDTLDLSGEASGVSVNLASGVLTHVGSTERDTLLSIERVVGTRFDDTFTSSSFDDTMVGGAGNDTYVVNTAGDVIIEQVNRGTDTINVATATTRSTAAATTISCSAGPRTTRCSATPAATG